ncbi:MAG: ExbD/TolR family protein [Syntrophobacteraceae bacterium]
MGMQMNSGRSQRRMVSEINVTPLVDVMLVLLIIFMVAAPMMVKGIDINLPVASARPIQMETERLVVSITGDGMVYINDSAVDFEMLGPELISLYMKSQDKRGVILRADRKVEYGLVARAMGAIREAGIDQIGMVTEPLSERRSDARSGL